MSASPEGKGSNTESSGGENKIHASLGGRILKFIRKTAWYGIPVTLAAIMAVAVLFTAPAQKAEANSALTSGVPVFSAPTQIAGKVETWTVTFTLDGSSDDDLASGDAVIVTFPAGFVIPAVPVVALTGAGWVGAGCIDANTTGATVGQVVTVTSGGVCIFDDSNSTAANLTIAGITNPTAAASVAAAGFIVSVNAADNDHDVANRAAGAAVEIGGLVFNSVGAPKQIAGLTETYTITATARDGIAGIADTAGGDTFAVTFPAGFVLPAAPTVVATGAGYATAADCSATAATVGQVVTVTLTAADADCVANVGVGAGQVVTFTLAGIRNETPADNAAAGFTIQLTNATGAAHPVQTVAANVRTVGITLSTSAISIPADGASTALISLTASGTATNSGGGLLSLSTDNGKFLTVPAPTDGNVWQEAGTGTVIAANGLTASTSVEDAIGAAADTVTLQAPSAVGTATIQLRAVPAGGGTAVLQGQITVSFTTPAAVPGAPASATLTSAGSATTLAPLGTLVLTTVYLDANGATPLAGSSIIVTTDLGTLSAPTNGTCVLQACTGSSVPGGGSFAVTLNHGGVAGAATVTVTRGSVIKTKTITLTGGTVDSITLDLVRTNTTTSFAAKSIITDRQSTTGDLDELIAVARTLDANGNSIVATGLVTFVVANSDGTAVDLLEDHTSGAGTETAAAGNITYATTACSGGVNTTTFACTDNVEASAGLLLAGAVAIIDVDQASTAPLARGTYTVTVTYLQGTTTRTATADFVVAGPADTITVVVDETIEIGGSGTATATVVDSDGNPVADRTVVTFAVSSAILQTLNATTAAIDTTQETAAGVASLTILGLAGGDAEVFGITGGKTGSAQVVVGTVTPAEPATPAADVAAVLTAPPAGGFTQGAAGTTDRQAFADAQTFTVAIMWRFDVATQGWLSFIPATDGVAAPEIAQTMTTMATTDIISAYSE